MELTRQNFQSFLLVSTAESPGGGYCHIWAIWGCAAVKGMVFKQFTLG